MSRSEHPRQRSRYFANSSGTEGNKPSNDLAPPQNNFGPEFVQYESWQRPPSRQKEPNQAQYLDDSDAQQSLQNEPYNQFSYPSTGGGNRGGRPRIDFFNQRNNEVFYGGGAVGM